MPEKLLCCTDNLLLFLVVGVFVALLGLILGILCISVYSMTDSVEYAESAIPSYVPALSLILTGVVVLILFKKRNKLLVSLAVVMTTFSVFLCLCTTVLVTLQVIPFMESFTHCVTHPTTEQCQCYVIDNLPSTVNSTSHIIDVGESEQVTFFGTSSCHVITETIVDILYTEVVIFAVGGFSCTIAMVFCVLMVCGGHQVNKTETDTIDALSEDHVSISGSMLGSAFSRRILIPGHSYTLGSRQAHNFSRPPYGTYLQEPMETYPFSSEAYPLRDSQGQHTHAEEPPAFGNILMTTAQVQRSEGDSSHVQRSEVDSSQAQRSERYRAQVERSSEVDSSQVALTGVSRLTQCGDERRQVQAGENISEADLPNRVRALEGDSVDNERSGVNRERNLSGARNTQRRDAHTSETTGGQNLPRQLIGRPQQHASLPDYGQFLAGTGRVSHARMAESRRGAGIRDAATRSQRQRGIADRHQRLSHSGPMMESYIPTYDGNFISVYTLPGSSEMFVNLRDVPSIPPPYSYANDFVPAYADQPPPYSPAETATAAGQQLVAQSREHHNRTHRTHNSQVTCSAVPLLDSVQYMSGTQRRTQNVNTDTSEGDRAGHRAPSQSGTTEEVPVTAIDSDNESTNSVTQTSEERTLSSTSERCVNDIPVTLIDQISVQGQP